MADQTAKNIGAPAFCGDWLLGALKPAHDVLAQLDRGTFLATYRSVLQSLIVRQCLLQQSDVIDCLVPDDVLAAWAAIAAEHDSAFYVCKCVCTDEQLH